ncbi:MAG TPA: lipoprotein insertase outer membrane protein LolB [Steroidobacteraceae bacterium]|nr:lipoprotein insertase outer membrane protein LolB [Steroidobacteraceae bacterium]
MRRERRRLGAALLAVLALVAGCRTLPPAPPRGQSWEVQRADLQALGHFELRGRVAVAAGDEGFNASLRWIQQDDRSEVTLGGPLGVGGAQLTASGDDLTVVTARGERIESSAAHEALAARLGFDPPLRSLRYWVLGVPDPAQPASVALDPIQQRLSALDQEGWHVEYQSYVSRGDDVLPARMTLQRDAVRVRLLVDDWHR